MRPIDVVTFWREAGYQKWFVKNVGFDTDCREQFLDTHHAAARGELEHWLGNAEGALALMILLDQIPRNIFRGSGHAFATDGLARRYAQQAIGAGFDRQVDPMLRFFFYMPFEHSEQTADQQQAVELFEALGNDELTKYARAHSDVIARFGRFPHRNSALGRTNTTQEQAWLDAGGGF